MFKEFLSLIFGLKLKALFVDTTDNTWVQLFRSLFVGGIATVADFGVTAVVRELLFGGADSAFLRILYVTCGFVAGLAVNFALSCLFVFPKSGYGRKKEFAAFMVIGVMGLVLNNGIIALAGLFLDMHGFIFYIIRAFATIVTFAWNFFVRKFAIYNKKQEETK